MELVTLGVTLMALKEYLRSKLDERGMTAAELARRSGVTKQNIGRILNDTPHPISGALPKVSVETIDKLAKALDVPLDEARLAAGYAPQTVATRPTTIPELVAALNSLGIEMPQLYEGLPDPNGEGFQEILERIYLDVELVTNRIRRGAKIISVLPLELAADEPDIEQRINNDKTKPLSRSG